MAPPDDQPDEVEAALGADLMRAPMVQANQRAEDLRHPAAISSLLDDWAAQGRFRRPLLGRLAHIHHVSSRNIYFYQLKVLYEQRGKPELTAEPDYHEQAFPLEREQDRWEVALPPVQEFEDDTGGQVVLPGSTRVVSCPECEGWGKFVCATCDGKQRIRETREVLANSTQQSEPAPGGGQVDMSAMPATRLEQVLVPCPDCQGSGWEPCDHCDNVGRLVQQSAFRWQRTAYETETSDDFPEVDERWLFRTCAIQTVYQERTAGNPRSNTPAVLPEWLKVAPLHDLLEQARDATNDQTRIVLSEVTIQFIPVTDVVIDLGAYDEEQPDDTQLYRLSIYGFENAIPPDWRFLNWERVTFLCATAFLLVLVGVFGYFAFVR
jgi:hypothetical protein